MGAPPFCFPHLYSSEDAIELSEHEAQRLPRHRVKENKVVVGIATTPPSYFIREQGGTRARYRGRG
jgi:hypothetical protein